MRKLFFFFIDGIGLGANESERNPLLPLFRRETGVPFCADSVPLQQPGVLMLPLETHLGVKGTPQSATGQTSIITGKNAPAEIGFHLTAFPNEPLIALIQAHSLFRDLTSAGIRATCANLYSREFFRQRRQRHRNMLPVSALSVEAAGLPFRYIEDYKRSRAVFADITNRMLIDRGFDLPLISPQQAARNLLNIFDEADFVFFEYFLTDTYGHARQHRNLQSEVTKLSAFLSAVLAEGDVDVLVVSDHGNAEDSSIAAHTEAPVPFLLFSRREELFSSYQRYVRSLLDIKPAVLEYFGIDSAPQQEDSGH
jgi:phosphopentomutase